MNSTLSERFNSILEYSGLSASDFARKVKIQKSSLSHILSGRNKPSFDFMNHIKDSFPEISLDWLITGKGSMLNSNYTRHNKEEKVNNTTEVKTDFMIITFKDGTYKIYKQQKQ